MIDLELIKGRPVLIELQYLPNLEYFIAFMNSEEVTIEAAENFVKQTYRNRCYVRSANKIEVMSIPIKKGARKIKDIKIDYRQSWLKDHWRTITSAYGKSPFFEYYRDGFESILFSKEPFLFDLNLKLLTKCLEYLEIKKHIKFTDNYDFNPKSPVLDLRSLILPKMSYQDRGIYRGYAYNQIFGKDFAGNLSIIDLLFCEGPGASLILNKSMADKAEQIKN
ncbi:WbqC family protein [Fulvivirgaceae bacterium BMA12]|uniref:WbqC family protein n=1 Tax=Agaribacillus aureus TaxID=3051825 RepID=A0ABT8LCW0_9BACT|nr:WbqC family protein [Fulvivirgaceae bacterium BMA12]